MSRIRTQSLNTGMPISIVGPGALGSLLHWQLHHLGFRVQIIDSKFQCQTSFFSSSDKDSVEKIASDQHALSTTGLVIFCVKAYQLEKALRQHLDSIAPLTPVWIISNGFVDVLVRRVALSYPQLLFRLGLSYCGVTQIKPRTYSLKSSLKPIHLGPVEPTLSIVSNNEKQLSEVFRWKRNIYPDYLRKGLLNCVINSLSVAYNASTNGELLQKKQEVQMLSREVFEIARLLWGTPPFSLESLIHRIFQTLKDTHLNENSMHQDVRLGRPTETDFLLGVAKPFKEYSFTQEILKRIS